MGGDRVQLEPRINTLAPGTLGEPLRILDHLLLAGAGTGGHVAAAVARRARDAGWPAVEHQVSIQQGTAVQVRQSLARSLRTWLHRIATNVCLDMLEGERGRGRSTARPNGRGRTLPPRDAPPTARTAWTTSNDRWCRIDVDAFAHHDVDSLVSLLV